MRHFPGRRRPAAAFTLIELLTVIAILGILAAILFPTVGAALDRAKRSADGANAREILKAAMIYAQDNDGRLPDPQTVPATTMTAGQRAFLWPGVIARNGILTDPKLYFSKVDPTYASNNPPLSIIATGDANKRTLDGSFTNRSPSYEFVGGLKTGDPATTPVLYTRGLQANGSWSITSGTYKDTGGYIAFLGGNVEFYANAGTAANTASAVFTSNNSARKVINIQQAIPFTPTQARLYGIPPPGMAILGSANGTLSQRGQ